MQRLREIVREHGTTAAIIAVGIAVIYLYQAGLLRMPHELEGAAAPQLELPLLDSGTLDLSAHQNKDVVVLDFWATWCPPCREGLPTIAQIAADYADEDVAVYAVNLMEQASLVEEFLAMSEIEIAVALDSDGSAGQTYKARSIPQTVVIGKDGIVRHVHVGIGNLDHRLRDEIDAALLGENSN